MATTTRPRDHGFTHRHPWLVPVLIVSVAALLITFVVWQRSGSGEPGDGAAATEPPAEVVDTDTPDLSEFEQRDPADPLTAGPVDAPVGLIVFSDYQCPYCASWSHETLPELMAYADAGDLRIEWRDVNIFGAESERAARASYAAARQDRYWDYHHALFPDGEPLPESRLSGQALADLAEELGLDRAQFAADLESAEVSDQIAANARQGIELGVHSTPAFILGGEPIVGAQPTEVFVERLDEALTQAGH